MKTSPLASYADLLQRTREILKNEILQLPRTPYAELLQRLRGKHPVDGLYIIRDAGGAVAYVGMSQAVRRRLAYHVSLGGDLIQHFLALEGFERRPVAGRSQDHAASAIRIRTKILETFTVTVLSRDTRKAFPLGVRDLERLVQYVLIPYIGYMLCSNNHPYRREWARITEIDG